MSSAKKAGKRLHAFLETCWGRERGGMTGLAEAAGIRRQTLYSWFSGDDEPSLGSLAALAGAIGVDRAEVVAAMDGHAAPPLLAESEEPRWARALLAQVLRNEAMLLVLQRKLGVSASDWDAATRELAERSTWEGIEAVLGPLPSARGASLAAAGNGPRRGIPGGPVVAPPRSRESEK